MSGWFAGLLACALAACLLFLTLPLLALFVDRSPAELAQALGEPGAIDALWLSLRTTAAALVVIVAVGTPAAYLVGNPPLPRPGAGDHARSSCRSCCRRRWPGIALLAALGPAGLAGGALEAAGIELSLATAGVVVALVFVASPFYLRQAIAAFGAVDPTLLDASRTLGATPARTFARVAVPTAMPGLVAGGALATGRALGEFGATLMFAGSFQGITQTVPLAIYDRFATDFTAALALSAVLVAVSAAILLGGQARARRGRARRCCALRPRRGSARWRSTSA